MRILFLGIVVTTLLSGAPVFAADAEDLAWWYEQTGGGIETAFLVHGEPESMEAIAPTLQKFVKNPVIMPEYGSIHEV